MPADNCQPQPLPVESDCEAGEVAPARAPRAWAGAAVLTAAAAALVLLAVAGRVGPSTGAATLAAPEAIVAKAEIPCAGFGESCAVSKCCSNPGDKCYRKHAYWSSCNQSCDPYSIYVIADNAWKNTSEPVWNCEEDTDTTNTSTAITADTSTAITTDTTNTSTAITTNTSTANTNTSTTNTTNTSEQSPCSEGGDNCAVTQCCADPSMTCYKKDDGWSACNATCNANSMWTADGWVETDAPVWDCGEVKAACSQHGESCAFSRCCADNSMKCYVKDEHWASCNQTCNPTAMWTQDGWVSEGGSWTCDDLTV